MTQSSSHRSNSPRARDMEMLETRQLFAGYIPSGAGFFPGLRPFTHYIEIDRGVVIDFGGTFGFPGANAGGGSQTSNSSNTSNSSASAARLQSADTSSSPSNVAVAPRVTLATADTAASENTDASPAAIVKSADAPAATATPAAESATPAPVINVAAMVVPQKLFSDRPVTAVAAPPAPLSSNGLMNLLTSATQNEAKTWQPESVARSHHANNTAPSDDSAQELSLHREQTPATATLATLPTGGFMNQPLWQRIAAASVTILILSVNWMLRRKREKATTARLRS